MYYARASELARGIKVTGSVQWLYLDEIDEERTKSIPCTNSVEIAEELVRWHSAEQAKKNRYVTRAALERRLTVDISRYIGDFVERPRIPLEHADIIMVGVRRAYRTYKQQIRRRDAYVLSPWSGREARVNGPIFDAITREEKLIKAKVASLL